MISEKVDLFWYHFILHLSNNRGTYIPKGLFFLSISTLLKLFDRLQCYKLSNDKVVKVLLLSFPSFALLSYIVSVVSFLSFGKKQLLFFFLNINHNLLFEVSYLFMWQLVEDFGLR